MMAMTTSSSIRVKALRPVCARMATHSFRFKDCEAHCERLREDGKGLPLRKRSCLYEN